MLSLGQLTTTTSSISQATSSTDITIKAVVFKNLTDTTKKVNLHYVPHDGSNNLGTPSDANKILEKTINPRETYNYRFPYDVVLNDEGDSLFADVDQDNKVNYFVLGN